MSTRKELETKIAELQAEYEAAGDDEDTEIWVKHGDTETKLRGEHGKNFLTKFLNDLGLVEEVEETDTDADTTTDDQAGKGKAGPYWPLGNKSKTG